MMEKERASEKGAYGAADSGNNMLTAAVDKKAVVPLFFTTFNTT